VRLVLGVVSVLGERYSMRVLGEAGSFLDTRYEIMASGIR